MSNKRPGFTLPKLSVPGITWQGLAAVLLVILALRIGYSITKRFDSDEPQHLHVVWAWTTGQLPYKDVFDNHAPLFQWLSSPLLWLIGERSDIVIPMRWAMLPLYFLSLYFVFRAGRTVLAPTAAWWAAVFGCLLPPFFATSIEFRPDDLWAALWFAFLAVLVEGRATLRRAFALGLVMGLTFAVSMKTTLLLLAIGFSIALLLLMKSFDKSQRHDLGRVLQTAAVGLAAILIAPAAIIGYFWAKGALKDLYYCVIAHNIVPGLKRWGHPHYLDPSIWALAAFLVGGAIVIYRQAAPGGIRDRRVLLFLAPLFYMLVLYGFWPDITREDDLPLYPLLPLAGFILLASPAAVGWRLVPQRLAAALPWIAFAGLLAWLVSIERPWKRENRRQMAIMSSVLKMTKPGDYFMDAKSGAVFRPRPFYYVLETVTRARLRGHLMKDNVPECLIDTHTAVADPRQLLQGSASEKFVFDNYLPLAGTMEIRAAGKLIENNSTPAGEPIRFEVAIPTRYTVLEGHERAAGVLDGVPLDQPRDLKPGEHSFVPSSPHSHLALFWAGAVDAGYYPALR